MKHTHGDDGAWFRTLSALILSVSLLAATTQPTHASENVELELEFALHTDLGMNEQDVFIEKVPGSGWVFRPTPRDLGLKLPLYSSAEAVQQAYFDPAETGPFPRGHVLPVTLDRWQLASGRGSYRCNL